jgi:hypothetical protein
MLICASGTAAFVINEFDSDTPNSVSGIAQTDYKEFIELKGNPGESAAGLVLVWFNGGSTGAAGISYRAIDLSPYTADSNGYLVGGTTYTLGCDFTWPINTLQNGEDAIGLYTGTTAQFPTGTQPTATGRIDFVVYETDGDPDANWSGFGAPFTVMDENKYGSMANDSICRMPDGGPWDVGVPSPRAANSQSAGYSVTSAANMDFLRLNQTLASQPTTKTLTIRNTEQTTLTVTALALDPSTSSAFTIVTGPTPALPAVLPYNQTATVVVQFQESDVSANKVYGGAVNYTCDSPTTPTGSVALHAELVRVTQTGSVGDLKINEICYDPKSNDYNGDGNTASPAQNDEFIELYNTTASPITIEGWEIRVNQPPVSGTGMYNFVFPAGTTIAANGFAVMFSMGTPTGFAPGTAFARNTTPAMVYNPGSLVQVNDATTVIDAVAYKIAEDSPDADGFLNMGGFFEDNGGSIGRRPDGASAFRNFSPTNVQVFDRPSPAASNNSPLAASDWCLFQ